MACANISLLAVRSRSARPSKSLHSFYLKWSIFYFLFEIANNYESRKVTKPGHPFLFLFLVASSPLPASVQEEDGPAEVRPR